MNHLKSLRISKGTRRLPVLDGRSLMEMEVTLAGMRSLLLWYNSPEQTLLLPPSTAHRPGSAPAKDTAPAPPRTRELALRYNFISRKPHERVQALTHKGIDAHTLAIVDAGDGSDHIVEEDLRESLPQHGFLQGLIHQVQNTVTAHGVQQPLHSGERVTVLLVLVDPVKNGIPVSFQGTATWR